MKNKMTDYAILLKFLLTEKCHRQRGKKTIVCLIPDDLNLLDKTGGWAVC